MAARPRSLFPSANSHISKKIPPRYQCYTFCFIVIVILVLCMSSMDIAAARSSTVDSPQQLIRLQQVGLVSEN